MPVLTTEMKWPGRRNNQHSIFHTSYEGYYLYTLASKNPVSKKEYVQAVLQVVEGFIELLLDGNSIFLPNVGIFSIVSRKSSHMPINWAETKKYWESHPEIKTKEVKAPDDYIRHLNFHTGGHVSRVKWSKIGAKLSNKHFYAFKPSKYFRTALRDRLRNGEQYPHG